MGPAKPAIWNAWSGLNREPVGAAGLGADEAVSQRRDRLLRPPGQLSVLGRKSLAPGGPSADIGGGDEEELP